jgi:hypothetical protein
VSAATAGQAVCRTAFAQPGTHNLAATYSGDAFYAASTSPVLVESVTAGSVTGGIPRLSGLRISSHRVSIGGRMVAGRCVKPTRKNNSHKYCRLPLRLKVAYTLNEAATVRLSLKNQVPGRKVKGRCVRQTKKNHKHARCNRLAPVSGTIMLAGKAGLDAFMFTGTIGGHRLGPGTYQLIASPTAKGRSGRPQTVMFRIVS